MSNAIIQPSDQFLAELGGFNVNALRANGTLRHEDYIKWDDKMIFTAKQRLHAVSDLVELGLVDSSYTLGDIVSKYEKVSDMTAANVNMDGTTRGQKDRLTFTEAGVPIPIFRKDFRLNKRQILSSQSRPGGSLSSTSITVSTRLVADLMEDMVWNGIPGIVEDSLQIYGYTNHPNRNTKTISNAWGGGSETPVADILDMIQLAVNDNFYGPYYLYVSKDNMAFIESDYSSSKGDKTYKERFEAISEISAVRVGYGLADGEVVLVQMTEDVVDLAVAQEIVNFEQPQTDLMQYDFTVMSAMAIRVKSDQSGQCGVVHATGA